MARMQKAISVIQFKLEGQAILRNPHFAMEHRNVLANIDYAKGAYRFEGVEYSLLDTRFPTIDPADPLTLTADERLVGKVDSRLPEQFDTGRGICGVVGS